MVTMETGRDLDTDLEGGITQVLMLCTLCVFFLLKALLAHLAESQVSYCHHLASVVIVVINCFSKLFSSDTSRPIGTNLGMNVPWGILHRTGVGIFDPSKNMAAMTLNRT